MDIREMREMLGDTQGEFAKRYGIPFRSVQNWEGGQRTPPSYVLSLLEEKVRGDAVNRLLKAMPSHEGKKPLPDSRDYLTNREWLLEAGRILGESFVFALDSALILDERFLGRHGEWRIYGYGEKGAERYKGVCLLGRSVSTMDIVESDGLRFTSFNRTLVDFLKNEGDIDMQGILEALSRYYYGHKQSFQGLFIPPEYGERFDIISRDAIDYYSD